MFKLHIRDVGLMDPEDIRSACAACGDSYDAWLERENARLFPNE